MNKIITIIFLMLALVFVHCGGTATGGTETGTTNVGGVYANLANRFEAAASKLVPAISASEVDSSISANLQFLTYGDDDLWADYLDGNNAYVITDVFGSSDEEPRVVTKIRVLLDDFKYDMDSIVSQDPDFECAGSAEALDEGDNIDIAFYGSIANGTAGDRFFDCVYQYSVENEESVISYDVTTLYGLDDDGVVRFVTMTDSLNENENVTEERGNTTHNLQVIMASYAEDDLDETTDTTTAYLDLQYNQATLYVGVDETADTDDDVYFKSRSRITGTVVLDSEGEPSQGVGDFSVIKYDRGLNDEDEAWTITTNTMGRGGYDSDQYSIFAVNTDLSSLEPQSTDYFCLEGADDGLPAPVADSNCTAFETAYAWDDAEFPFTLTPGLEQNFEDREFFEEADLIASDGSDFEIPTYEIID